MSFMERAVHPPRLAYLMKPALGGLLLAGLLFGGGCQGTSVQTPEQQAAKQMASFLSSFEQVLKQGVNRYNVDDRVGGLALRAVIDRRNAIVGCTAEPLPDYPLERFPDNRQLAPLLEGVCWNMVFPRAGPQLFSGAPGGNLQVVLPVVFPRPKSRPMEEQRVRATVRGYNVQEQYLWQQLFAQEHMDSIGIARLRVRANGQEQVADCQVELAAIDERVDDFRQDPDLRQRLEARCATLDLQQMSVFLVSRPEGQSFLVELEYTPWKVLPYTPGQGQDAGSTPLP